jgi:hypothetical protein
VDDIEVKDVEGRTVRVDEGDVLAAIANRLRDDERIYFARTIQPLRYFCLRMVDDSEVPG